MAAPLSSKKKKLAPPRVAKRNSVTGPLVGRIGEADAKRFRAANASLMKEMAGSRAKAVEVLKGSGFLGPSGKLAKRYR